MNRGRCIKVRDDKSSGIEILMTYSFSKINQTEPIRLAVVYYESIKRELKTRPIMSVGTMKD
jgi:hypothetical protein